MFKSKKLEINSRKAMALHALRIAGEEQSRHDPPYGQMLAQSKLFAYRANLPGSKQKAAQH